MPSEKEDSQARYYYIDYPLITLTRICSSARSWGPQLNANKTTQIVDLTLPGKLEIYDTSWYWKERKQSLVIHCDKIWPVRSCCYW